jgi:LPXTG-motif cell wall-anchored protein
MLALSLIICGILLRFAGHAPNFTPVAAIALFSGVYLSRKKAFIVPLALMIISDMFLGMHNVVIFTWGGFALTTALGLWLKKRKTVMGVASTSIASSLLFYLISNFGVWLMGWYPRTLSGLLDCYIMAIPFLRNFTLATLIYSGIFFGLYELVARLAKDTKFSSVLLNTK